MSDSLRSHGLQPTSLLRPWDFQARVRQWGAIAFSGQMCTCILKYTFAFFVVKSTSSCTNQETCRIYDLLSISWEKVMAPHSSTLARKIPWMEKPGRLQSMGSLESDMTERLHFQFSLSCIGEGNGNPLQCSCLENPRDGEAWWAAIYGVAWSRTQLK